MKVQSTRDLVSMGVIAVAMVGGVAMLINGRLEQGLERRHSLMDTLSAEARFSPDASRTIRLASEADRLFAWLDQGTPRVEAPWSTRLLELGEREDVRIDRIDPIAQNEDDEDFARSYGFTVEATGEYERVARFLAAIEGDSGFNVVTRFSLTPVEHADGETVHAMIQTAHYSFDPAALAITMAAIDEEDE